MKQQIIFLVCCMSLLFLVSCDDTDNNDSTLTCGDAIIVDVNYDNTISDPFTISDVEMSDNCLTATIQYGGGCDDDLVSFGLLGSTAAFPFSLPALLEMKIILDDDDQCEALVTKEISFDLSPLEEAGYNNINIALDGWNAVMAYQY